MDLRKISFLAFTFLLSFNLAACLADPTPLPPTPTHTALPPTETPTPTVVWFPPTATPTPVVLPTMEVVPTADLRPDFGELIFADDFSDPAAWVLEQSAGGSIAVGREVLTIAIQEGRGYLTGIRQEPALSSFYAEVTASPSLCRGSDEYGMLLRVNKSKDFYRFGLTCDGQARLDRYYNGSASAPQPPVVHWAVPPGAPSSSRLAVLAQGKEMRFYANGEYLFTVNDGTIAGGTIGLFARSTGSNAVTVNFSDLAVYRPVP